jgi:hypothetical protein
VPAKPRRISDIKPLFTNLAQTSHYQVLFGGLPVELRGYVSRKGVSPLFIGEDVGLLCFNASLPTTTFSPKTVDGNFTGVQEKFAVARLYNEIDLQFYVDSNYKTLKFLESWMEFIASGSYNPIDGVAGSVSQANYGYFTRMQYPEYYKSNYTRIIKFDRDYGEEIEYRFIGLWPVAMSSPQVSYVQSDILKVSVSFQYDRYIAGRAMSLNIFNGDGFNLDSTIPQAPNQNQDRLIPRTGQSLGNEPGVRRTYTPSGSVIPTIIE